MTTLSRRAILGLALGCAVFLPRVAEAHGTGVVRGTVRDAGGLVLPGVTVEMRRESRDVVDQHTVTDNRGVWRFERLDAGAYRLVFRLLNFASVQRDVKVDGAGETAVDVTMTVALNADVIVTGRTTFTNLADVEDPGASLVGIAYAASQGAVTAKQIERRPLMRAGDVLESVPGVVISQHSGEGKANQYYLRGFNLDHGTDFATTVAGVPVNLPTHAHGHGYSDTNFLIPELVVGVQFSKGPYFADQGDFASAGSAAINYANTLPESTVRVSVGQDGWSRVLAAGSPHVMGGHLLYALELNHNDGPWTQADDYRRVNGVLRYSRGDNLNGVSFTAMGYRGTWHATDQAPARAIDAGALERFGGIDLTGGGDTSRYSVAADWQRSTASSSTRATAYSFHYDLDLFSDFTYFLDDPVNGDQFEQADSRLVSGGRVTHRRIAYVGNRAMQHQAGVQVRNDAIGTVGLYHTRARQRLATVREDSVLQTTVGAFYQNEYQWTSWLRTNAGLRGDAYRFRVKSDTPSNSGTDVAALVSPKGGAVLGPWIGTELYVNGGFGFHSNDARGATIRVDPTSGAPLDRVTPLVRTRGAELGLRTVAIPHVQATVALWTLGLDSELVFVGDAGTTEAGRPSRRSGIEITAYASPVRGLVLDADLALSRARFTDDAPEGRAIPGAVGTVASAGAAYERGRASLSGRWRYVGPRPLVEDGSVRSNGTGLLNLQGGVALRPGLKLVVDLFNALDARASDIDYFYTSRLPGEPLDGVADLHTHPSPPRTLRLGLDLKF